MAKTYEQHIELLTSDVERILNENEKMLGFYIRNNTELFDIIRPAIEEGLTEEFEQEGFNENATPENVGYELIAEPTADAETLVERLAAQENLEDLSSEELEQKIDNTDWKPVVVENMLLNNDIDISFQITEDAESFNNYAPTVEEFAAAIEEAIDDIDPATMKLPGTFSSADFESKIYDAGYSPDEWDEIEYEITEIVPQMSYESMAETLLPQTDMLDAFVEGDEFLDTLYRFNMIDFEIEITSEPNREDDDIEDADY